MIDYLISLGAAVVCTIVCLAIYPFLALTNLVMVFLLGTLWVAARGRRGPAILSSLLGVLCFDFFFVPPRFTFAVSDTQYIFTFLVMFSVAMTITHLTLRVREESESARRAQLEAEKDRMRSSLLSSVSHDLKTPLAAIIGSASSLLGRKSLADAEARELLENIQSEGERLSRLVHNLIETNRLESGTVLRKEACSLEEIIGASIERVDKLLGDRKVTLDMPADLPLVEMDGVLMQQLFINLLENAARHTPTGTQIDISAWLEGASLWVQIADHGPGLAPDELERVFEKFYHAKSKTAGAGLGLAICRAVVNAHGGRIWAENRPGGGAVFRLVLPAGSKTHV